MSVAQLHPVIPAGEDHHFEPAPGLPEALPHDETLVWRGSPDHNLLARRVFHVRKVAGYFLLLLAWAGLAAWHDGVSLAELTPTLVVLSAVGLLAVGILNLLARLTARHTVYTVTDKRVVLAIGIALQIRLNLPYSRIDGVAIKAEKDGSGDIAVELQPGNRISYVVLWPHARPWRLATPQPALRCLPDVEMVGARIAAGVSGSTAAEAGEAVPA